MRKFTAILAAGAALCALAFAGGAQAQEKNEKAAETESLQEKSVGEKEAKKRTKDIEAEEGAENAKDVQATEDAGNLGDTEEVKDVEDAVPRVLALKGPTAMGMAGMMEEGQERYVFQVVSAVDEVTPLLVKGNADIAALPANLASILFHKTEGQVQVIAVNTLGVLYLCENGRSGLSSVEDLRGKTIYASGRGATPEYALNYILSGNGLDPKKDVTIEWKSEHTECLQALLQDEGSAALLPQPFVTSAQMKNASVRAALDLTEEWEKLQEQESAPSAMVTGVTVVRREFAQEHPEAVEAFLKEYEASISFVREETEEAAALIEQFGIFPAQIAQKAIPECNLVCITGEEMRTMLSGYLKVLYGQEPKAVGGALPDDAFYYGVF